MIRIKQHFKLYKYFFMLIFLFYITIVMLKKVAEIKLIYKQNNVSGLKTGLLRNLSFNEIHDIKLSLLCQ
jgi:hypothetical protein